MSKRQKWDRKDIFPSNGGLLLFVDVEENPVAFERPHLEATVVRTGNGVPWLKPGSRVIVPTDKLTGFAVQSAEIQALLSLSPEQWERIGEYVTLHLASQTDVLGLAHY